MDSEVWDRRYARRELILACGEGRNAVWLAEQGWQVRRQPVDILDQESVGLARPGAGPGPSGGP